MAYSDVALWAYAAAGLNSIVLLVGIIFAIITILVIKKQVSVIIV
jgi:hypothetical protein